MNHGRLINSSSWTIANSAATTADLQGKIAELGARNTGEAIERVTADLKVMKAENAALARRRSSLHGRDAKALDDVTEAARREVEARRLAEKEARDALVAAANDALPDEPAAGGDDVVDIAVKLPDGRRVRRRFCKSHPLQSVFNFLVSHEHLAPGTYRLMSQFPRRAFEDHAPGAPTLEEAGLTQKQEALFVDLL